MIAPNAEVHTRLKAERLPPAHFNVRNDVIGHAVSADMIRNINGKGLVDHGLMGQRLRSWPVAQIPAHTFDKSCSNRAL
jgi:hypothetical protein